MHKRALIDPVRKQVACVIIQAAYGGDRSVVHEFDDWLVAPTPDMKWFTGTIEEWRQLAKAWRKR
jgi:hypothetical protein